MADLHHPSIFFLLLCALITLAGCDDSDMKQNYDTLPTELIEKVKSYPVSYSGTASVSKFYQPATCVRNGDVKFTANKDGTCALYVSFPMTFLLPFPPVVLNGIFRSFPLLLKSTAIPKHLLPDSNPDV
jgi:hypothetical protein